MVEKGGLAMVISPSIFDTEGWKAISKSAGHIYMYLSIRADHERKCWPSINRMSSDLKIERRTAIIAVNELVKIGFLKKMVTPGVKSEYTVEPVTKALPVTKGLPVRGLSPTSSKSLTGPVTKALPEQIKNRSITDNTSVEWNEKQKIKTSGSIDDYLGQVKDWLNSAPDTFWMEQETDFPEIDIEGETQKALDWLKDTPDKRAKSIKRFFRNWYRLEMKKVSQYAR
jgi:hypothetical protein